MAPLGPIHQGGSSQANIKSFGDALFYFTGNVLPTFIIFNLYTSLAAV